MKFLNIKEYIIIIKDEKINNSSNTKSQKENSGFQEQVLTYLTSTKERIIDLTFVSGYKGYFPIFNKNINDRFQEFNNKISRKLNLENKEEEGNSYSIHDFPQKPKTLNVNKNSINSINKNSINSINNINQKLKNDSMNQNIKKMEIENEEGESLNGKESGTKSNQSSLNMPDNNIQSKKSEYKSENKDKTKINE